MTDSVGIVQFDEKNQPGVANLLTIYSVLTNKEIPQIVQDYEGLGYKEFKEDLSVIVSNEINEIQKKYKDIVESDTLDMLLDRGQETASKLAYKKLQKAKQKLGLGRKRK